MHAHRAPTIAILLVATLLVTGCADVLEDDGDEPGGEDPSTFARCDEVDFQIEGADSDWHVGQISCDANRTGENSQAVTCPRPGETSLTASANLSAGQVEIAVVDGASNRVAEHRLSDTDGKAQNLSIDEDAQAGDWQLVGERLEDFEGTYRAELGCAQ